MTNRLAVVAEALSWLGTPYHHHGRIKGVGVDCAQILCAVYEAANVTEHVELGNYARDWHLHRSVEMYVDKLSSYMAELEPGTPPQLGDVALFQFGRTFSHGGIVVSPDTVLHAYLNRGVIVTRWATEDPLAGRPVRFFSPWGVYE